ncbi:MAG: glycosyltransferase family 9 protein [Candidatus Daviesbacteria bacterium]|nr:MAG: glycosyltransferase family 9 protein [Candidatus Daviesbacteria bacterium]
MIDPNRVRNIDRIIGSRICWFLSQWSRVTRRRREPKKIKKILFIKISEMGSTILSFPAINFIKKEYPEAQLYFLTFSGNEEIVKILKSFPEKNIYLINNSSIPHLIFDTLKAAKMLRDQKIDVIVDFELFSRISAILGYLIKSPIHIGFYKYHMEGLYRGDFFTHKVIYNHYLHTSLAFLTLAKSIKEPFNSIPLLKKRLTGNLRVPRYKSSKNEIENLWKKIQSLNPKINPSMKLVIFNTHASDFVPERKWPKEYFAKLAQEILKQGNTAIILIGTAKEINYIQDVENKINHPLCINFAGQTDIYELLTLYNISHLMVTNDSGPAHFAAMTPIYIISLFGPETPLLYAPLSTRNVSLSAGLACDPCINTYNARRSPCIDNLCMSELKVKEVLPYMYKIMGLPKPKMTDVTTYNMKDLLAHINAYNKLSLS